MSVSSETYVNLKLFLVSIKKENFVSMIFYYTSVLMRNSFGVGKKSNLSSVL